MNHKHRSINQNQSRRHFLRALGTAAAGAGLLQGNSAWAHALLGAPDAHRGDAASPLPQRPLGKTGVSVSALGLGGEATIQTHHRRDDALRIINRALDLGVNYVDTSPTYGAGGSETNIGAVMAERRDQVFLATKTHDRSYDGTMRLFEQSLKRLRTDRIDLYQIHNVRTHPELSQALGAQGAVKALERLRSDGVIRFTGITGHRDPDLLLRGITAYPFDCLLMSLNAADIHYKPFQTELLAQALERRMGIVAMKVAAVGRIFRKGGITSMEQALGYTLSFPVSTAIVGISTLRELEENVHITGRSEPLGEKALAALEVLSEPYAAEGNFFKHHW